jgi:hypothetical protein
MNHRAFQRRREIRRRLGRFRVVPDRHLIRRRQLQHAIEVVLPRAALIVDQLRDTEPMNRIATLRTERFYKGNASFNESAECILVCSGASASDSTSCAGLIGQIDRELQLNVVARSTSRWRADPVARVPARSISATSRSSCRGSRALPSRPKDQTIFSARRRNIQQPHTFKLLAPRVSLLEIC